MSSITIYPKQLKGDVTIPPSKSMAHRAIICAALAKGVSRLYNIDFSDDIIATIAGMESFGATISKKGDHLEIKGTVSYEGCVPNKIVDCKESGSTLRFLVPISLLFSGETTFTGEGNLGKRPLDTYYEIFQRQGISYTAAEGELHLTVEGHLLPGEYRLRGDVSSQFISGLLFSLPLLKGDSKIVITTDLESRSYIDLTLEALKAFGIEIANHGHQEFVIQGGQSYKSRDYTVEGDYSQGAFFLVANALGSQINLLGLKEDSQQGDKEAVDILKRMGARFTQQGPALTATAPHLEGTLIDAAQCPDIIPVLTVAAALSEGTTTIINAGRLRIKECDRLHATATELNKLGANVVEGEDSLRIEGVSHFKGGTHVWSHKDHRIAMSLAIAATRCQEPIVLKDFECVSKSYPHFFEDYQSIGGESHERHLG